MEWFNINEKKPDNRDNVLLYTPYNFFGEAHSCIGNIEGIKSCQAKIGNRVVPIFTHWMPLPSKPQLESYFESGGAVPE